MLSLRAEAAGALGGLKDLRAVAPLIGALREGDKGVSDKAHEALQELTAQKFGTDPARWREWWLSRFKEAVTRVRCGREQRRRTTALQRTRTAQLKPRR